MNYLPKEETVYLVPADEQATIDLASGAPHTGTRFMIIGVGEGCGDLCQINRIVHLASFDQRYVTAFEAGWIVHFSAILVYEEFAENVSQEDRPTATEVVAVQEHAAAVVPMGIPQEPAPPKAATPPPPRLSAPVPPAPAQAAAPPSVPGYPGVPSAPPNETEVTTTVTAGPAPVPRTNTPPRRAPGTPRRGPQPPRTPGQ